MKASETQYQFFCNDHQYGWSITEDGTDPGCIHCTAEEDAQ